MYRITIGDKAYSSWSLRGWLCLVVSGVAFEETLVRMYDPAFSRMQAANAPACTVPQLSWREGGTTRRIWDTAAIAETLADRHPEAGLWPADPWCRAVARTAAAEMHSGFNVLRKACPMNFHRQGRPLSAPPEGLDRDLARLGEVWGWALEQTGGPWLGGARFSAVDAFYAPVASRLESYALMTPATERYADGVLAHPAMQRWRSEALADPRRLSIYDRD